MKIKTSNLIIAQQSYENDSCLRTMLILKFFLRSALFSLFPFPVSFYWSITRTGIQLLDPLFWQSLCVWIPGQNELSKLSLAFLQPYKSTDHSQNDDSRCGTTDCIEQGWTNFERFLSWNKKILANISHFSWHYAKSFRKFLCHVTALAKIQWLKIVFFETELYTGELVNQLVW